MKPIRVYIDTSIIGGKYDSEFHKASEMFFEQEGYQQIAIYSPLEVISYE